MWNRKWFILSRSAHRGADGRRSAASHSYVETEVGPVPGDGCCWWPGTAEEWALALSHRISVCSALQQTWKLELHGEVSQNHMGGGFITAPAHQTAAGDFLHFSSGTVLPLWLWDINLLLSVCYSDQYSNILISVPSSDSNWFMF